MAPSAPTDHLIVLRPRAEGAFSPVLCDPLLQFRSNRSDRPGVPRSKFLSVVNPFGSVSASSVLNRYWVPVHLSGGYRFPGVFPEFLGENVWTLGSDLLLGFGDRDGDPTTPAAVFLPGVFLDIERVLFDEAGLRRDYRTDPRPYNYRVNSVVFRIAAYLNLSNLGSGNIIMPSFGVSYQYNIIGPRIPDHEFKETRVIYLHELYREDLERQVDRRFADRNSARSDRRQPRDARRGVRVQAR